MESSALKNIVSGARKLDSDESGATATEYIIIIALIAIALVAIITAFGESLFEIFKGSKETLDERVRGQGSTAVPTEAPVRPQP